MSMVQMDNADLDSGNDNLAYADSTPSLSSSISTGACATRSGKDEQNGSGIGKKRKYKSVGSDNCSFTSGESGIITHEHTMSEESSIKQPQQQQQQGQHVMNNANHGWEDQLPSSPLPPQPSSLPPSPAVDDNDPTILKYEVNERVYVREDSQVYLAKVLKTRFRTTATIGRGRKKHIKSYHPPPSIVPQESSSNASANENADTFQPFWEYYIHFNGWKKSHDKWCRDECIMKDCERGKELAEISKERLKKEEMERKERKLRGNKKRKTNSDESVKRKDSLSSTMMKTFAEYCTLPFTLKVVLVEDEKTITRLGRHVAEGYDPIQCKDDFGTGVKDKDSATIGWTPSRMVHSLPAKITVEAILKQFAKLSMEEKQKQQILQKQSKQQAKQKRKEKNKNDTLGQGSKERTTEIYESFNRDIIGLFNTMLPKYLLYRGEREQYTLLWEQNQKKQKEDGGETSSCINHANMAKIYGGEFLLRLLVRLPMVISAFSETPPPALESDDTTKTTGSLLLQWKKRYLEEHQFIGSLISELILFLQKYKKSCFKGNYRTITAEEYTANELILIEKSKIICKASR